MDLYMFFIPGVNAKSSTTASFKATLPSLSFQMKSVTQVVSTLSVKFLLFVVMSPFLKRST